MSQLHVYRTDALVLRRQDFGEADRILTFYSPWRGKFRAIAKGVRRPKSRLGGHVELFTHVNVLVAQGRNLDIVTQAEIVRPFGRIRDDLWKTSYACYVAELVDRFTEEHLENKPVFELLLQALTYLDETEPGAADAPPSTGQIREPGEAGSTAETAMRSFELRLLGHLGYEPELFQCVQCHERLAEGENRFSPSGGGAVCAACAPTHPGARVLSVNAVKAMRMMSREPFGIFRRLRLTPDQALEVEAALRSHINFIVERQLRTSEFLDRMKADRKRERRQATLAGANA
jgi:DNA repair protein RecO (recombination protein O)